MATVKTVKGDLTTAKENYICHQVNCQGVMNSGVAKAIREKWSDVFIRYKGLCNIFDDHLGQCQLIKINENQHVINMFAQERYGYDGKRYTNYEAFAQCLETMNKNLPRDASIAFPWKIGSERGGANWEVISSMILNILGNYEREIVFYKLGDS